MSQSCACSLFLAKTNEKDACSRVSQSSSLLQSCAKEKSSGVEIDFLMEICVLRPGWNWACASCATFLFLPYFDVICDLLLNRRTATHGIYLLNRSRPNSAAVFPSEVIHAKEVRCVTVVWYDKEINISGQFTGSGRVFSGFDLNTVRESGKR